MINKVYICIRKKRTKSIYYLCILAYHETLQDKLGQLKDAREALNALRDEHLENKKRQTLERDRQRQIQLAVKLDDMRQKKQVK